jgi:hypothetical protein
LGRGLLLLLQLAARGRAGRIAATQQLVDMRRCPGPAGRDGFAQADHLAPEQAQLLHHGVPWEPGLEHGEHSVRLGLDLAQPGFETVLLRIDPLEGHERLQEAIADGLGAAEIEYGVALHAPFQRTDEVLIEELQDLVEWRAGPDLRHDSDGRSCGIRLGRGAACGAEQQHWQGSNGD